MGKAIDLKSRVSSYFVSSLATKTAQMVSQIDAIVYTIVESEIESLLLEAYYIKQFQPKYNSRLTDDKLYPSIRITIKDKYPKILYARKHDDPKSLYFGPFPHASAVKMVMRIIRHVFPFESVVRHAKRICLYNHLGLCPCSPVFDSEILQKEYRSNTRSIIRILEGKSKDILKELVKKRDVLSKTEQFEDAAKVQKQITALEVILQPVRKPMEYAINPNLRSDLRQEELDDLAVILRNSGCLVKSIRKIECYDTSNIQGKQAVGSMVVFVDGEKETKFYRKYKIRREETPDDFASMEEVLTRRLKHTEWEYPDLIIVDGGKGQISSALKAFAKYNVSLPLIGLAKREETIVIPVLSRHSGKRSDSRIKTWTSRRSSEEGQVTDQRSLRDSRTGDDEKNFREVSLSKDSKALLLIMRIRDEAHRFAITYHRKLRSKSMLRTEM
ncbi:MAG TPA: hypothetical protein VJC10_01145 [Patescibacteria group bacterium]|nr:hypothetical protein [Patescibacteria group bacterium]